jgi:hypothetical protein
MNFADLWPSQSYVRVRGYIDASPSHMMPFGLPMVMLDDESDSAAHVLCNVPPGLETGRSGAVRGRLLGIVEPASIMPNAFIWFLRPEQSRFTWQSITGLIVGAIGIGVLTFSLRRWQNCRNAV